MKNHLKELYKFRELLGALVVREIKVRYKQSILGVAWAVIQPIAMMVVFSIIFGKFIKVSSEGVPYPIFSFSALLFWTFFATSLSTGSNSVINQANLVRKIYFPREVLPMAAVIAAFVDFCIAGIIFLGMMIYYKMGMNINFLYILVMVPLQIMFTFAVVFFFSAINVYFRDIRHAVPFLVQIWMYGTPIVYSMSVVPENLQLPYVILNPMAGLIDGYRAIILHGSPPSMIHLSVIGLITLILFVLSYLFFKKLEQNFADVI